MCGTGAVAARRNCGPQSAPSQSSCRFRVEKATHILDLDLSPALHPALRIHGNVSQRCGAVETQGQTDGHDERIENGLLARRQGAALVEEDVEVEEHGKQQGAKPP